MSNTFIELIKSEEVKKFNPYHDRLGRFSTAGTAMSVTYRPGASAAHDKAIAREKRAHEWYYAYHGTGKDLKGNRKPYT